MKCGVKSEVNERMMDLTVEIEGDIATLEQALDKFICTEILDGENKYKCTRSVHILSYFLNYECRIVFHQI